jgi:aminopeptidase N
MTPGESEQKKTDDLFKYYPEDFGEIPVSVRHMDLEFDIYDDHTIVSSKLHATTRGMPIEVLNLNAKNLEILSIRCDEYPISYNYNLEASLLTVRFDRNVPPNSPITIITETTCRPTKNILEGLYYDETPPGAPPQQITQCQQWGFQRIVPCIDDMTAKCTYTTTINADERYTNLITNGDISVPRHPIGNGRDSITYDNTITPMAPYLFFLGVGTYDTYVRPFEYPEGSTFSIELLVPPGSSPDRAREALEILADAILWIQLFTGPKQYEKQATRREIYRLVKERDGMIAAGGDPAEIDELRKQLSALISTIQPGYTYTGTVYREIGMQNSDFGGMENVGNTTITTNRIMPFPQITDSAYEYMIQVKVHEFYHNLNGSEVTGRSPFEIWLNEAVTVHIEKQYHAFLFGETYSRLQTVLTLLSPDGGTFFYDHGAGSMPIEPDGFNDPNELITGVTYVKAPEFVRMIEKLMGRERFVQGLDRYHRLYRHANASRAQWIESMETAAGDSFSPMAHQWLKQTGYPIVICKSFYDPETRNLRLELEQKGPDDAKLWEFPFIVALVDRDGNDIAEQTVRVRNRLEEVVFEDTVRPAFLSLNRGYSAYCKVQFEPPDEELVLQLQKDTDPIGRYLAWYRLLDREKMRLLQNPVSPVSDSIIELFYHLLTDEHLMDTMGGQFLALFESVDDETYAHRYQDLFDVKRSIQRAIAQQHKRSLIAIYQQADERLYPEKDVESRIRNIKIRQFKNVALGTLASLDTPDIHQIIRHQFEDAKNASDRLAAFGAYLNSTAQDRLELLDQFEIESQKHPVAWETFLSVVAGSSSNDAVTLIKHVEGSAAFRIEQANDQRALFVRFAMNKKKSLQTKEGREYLQDILFRLADVNENSTVRMLSVLGNIDRMEDAYHIPLVEILINLLNKLDLEKTPSVYNTARRLLRGAPIATARYIEGGGQIPE